MGTRNSKLRQNQSTQTDIPLPSTLSKLKERSNQEAQEKATPECHSKSPYPHCLKTDLSQEPPPFKADKTTCKTYGIPSSLTKYRRGNSRCHGDSDINSHLTPHQLLYLSHDKTRNPTEELRRESHEIHQIRRTQQEFDELQTDMYTLVAKRKTKRLQEKLDDIYTDLENQNKYGPSISLDRIRQAERYRYDIEEHLDKALRLADLASSAICPK